MTLSRLPSQLGSEFSTAQARHLGVTEKRLRMHDLERPFRGVRLARAEEETQECDRFAISRSREIALIRALGSHLTKGHFFCHQSAAALWKAPLPYRRAPGIHLGAVLPQRAPRILGVVGHGHLASRVTLAEVDGLPLTSPAYTFASLGSLPLHHLVALGDYFVRQYREGVGRPSTGMAQLASVSQLRDAVGLGRWHGSVRLRLALDLVREDAWSPRESQLRVTLVQAGLPEPELNVDLFDDCGHFLGCIDMVYREYKVAIEYQGEQHSSTYARDVERIERMRACGWVVLQVTKELLARPNVLVARVAGELRGRGWSR